MKILLKIMLLLIIIGGLIAGVYFAPFWTAITSLLLIAALVRTYKVWLWTYLTTYVQAKEASKLKDESGTPVANVEEGTGKLFLRSGRAWRFVTSNPETDPDESWNLPRERDDANPLPEPTGIKTKQSKLHPFAQWIDEQILPGGMRWTGFHFMGNKVWWYNFRWEVLRESEPKDEDGLIGKRPLKSGKWVASFSKRINYVYLKDAVYYFEVVNAETKGRLVEAGETATVGMAIKVELVMTVQVVNPYLALITIHDWLQSIQDLIRPAIRYWISRNFYEDVIAKPDVAEKQFDVFLQQSGVTEEMLEKARADSLIKQDESPKKFAEYIERVYGIRIKRIGFDSIVPPDSYDEAAQERVAAEQKKVQIETLAQAEANRQRIVAQGESDRIKIVTAAIKDNEGIALRLRGLEALEHVGENGNVIIVDGSKQQLLIDPAELAGRKGKEGEK